MSGRYTLNYTRAWVAEVQSRMSGTVQSMSPEPEPGKCPSDYDSAYDYTKVDRSQIDKEYELYEADVAAQATRGRGPKKDLLDYMKEFYGKDFKTISSQTRSDQGSSRSNIPRFMNPYVKLTKL